MENEIEILEFNLKREIKPKKINNFAYCIEIDFSEYTQIDLIRKRLVDIINSDNSADYLVVYKINNEVAKEMLIFHISKYMENYQDYIKRIFREVFYEFFNIGVMPVKNFEMQIDRNAISSIIKINVGGENSMEKELGEEVELDQVKGSLKIAFEKHFNYTDIINTTVFQVLGEVVF